MPTINQLIRKGRVLQKSKPKYPALEACPHLLRGFGDMNMTPQAECARLDRHIAQKLRRAQVWRVRPQPGPNTPIRLPMPARRDGMMPHAPASRASGRYRRERIWALSISPTISCVTRVRCSIT